MLDSDCPVTNIMEYSPGDLTDSKSQNQRKSRQYEEEWIIYRNVLNEANISEKVLWLDIRGNHGKKTFSTIHILITIFLLTHFHRAESDISKGVETENSVADLFGFGFRCRLTSFIIIFLYNEF